jgi:hypothetical protein
MPSRGGGWFCEERWWDIGLDLSQHDETAAALLLFGQSSSTFSLRLLQRATEMHSSGRDWESEAARFKMPVTHAACGS